MDKINQIGQGQRALTAPSIASRLKQNRSRILLLTARCTGQVLCLEQGISHVWQHWGQTGVVCCTSGHEGPQAHTQSTPLTGQLALGVRVLQCLAGHLHTPCPARSLLPLLFLHPVVLCMHPLLWLTRSPHVGAVLDLP